MPYHSLILDGLAIAASLNAPGGRLLLEEFNPEDPRHLWEVTSLLPLIEAKEPAKKVFDVSNQKYEAGTLIASFSKNKGLNQNFAFTDDTKRIYPVKAPKLFITRSGKDVVLFPLDPKDTTQVVTRIPEGTYVKNLISNTGDVAAKIIFPSLGINKIVEIPAGAKDIAVFSIPNTEYTFHQPGTTDFVFDGEAKTAKNTAAGAKITISVRKPRATKVLAKVEAGSTVNTPKLTWKTDDGSSLASYEIFQKEPTPAKLLKKVTGTEFSYALEVEANVEYRFYVVGTSDKNEKFQSELQRVFVSGSLQLEHQGSTTEAVTIAWQNAGASFLFESFSVLMNGKVIASNLKPNETPFKVTAAHGVDKQEENYFVVEGKTKSGRTIVSNEISAGLVPKPRETKVILKVAAGTKPNDVVLNWNTDDGSSLASYNIIQKVPTPEKLIGTEHGNVQTTTVQLEPNVDYEFVVEGVSDKNEKFVSAPQKTSVKGALELEHRESTTETVLIAWENTGASFSFDIVSIQMNGKVIAENVKFSETPFLVTKAHGVDKQEQNTFVVIGKTKSGKTVQSNEITAGLLKKRETKVILKVAGGSDPAKPNDVVLNWNTDDGSSLASYNVIQKVPAPEKVIKTEKGDVQTTTVQLEPNVDYEFVVEGVSDKEEKFVSEPQKASVKGALELKHKESTGDSITISWENTGAQFFFESFTVKLNGKVIAENVTGNSYKATQDLDIEDENKFVVEGKTKSGKIVVSNIITAGLGFTVVPPITGETGGMK